MILYQGRTSLLMNHRLLYGWLSKDPVPGLKMLAGKHQNTINTVAEDYMVENEKKMLFILKELM